MYASRALLGFAFSLITALSATADVAAAITAHEALVQSAPALRQPNWVPQVVETHSNGRMKRILFTEPQADGTTKTVQEMIYDQEGNALAYSDLAELAKDSDLALERGTHLVPHGAQATLYPGGGLQKLTQQKMGVVDGWVRTFHPNGNLATEVNAVNGVLDGPVVEYDADGHKVKEGTYVNGKLSGEFTTYFPDGKRQALQLYADGVLEGECTEWYANGNIQAVKRYTRGVLHGNNSKPAVTRYYDDRSIAEVQDFRNGQAYGTYFSYYPNGKEQHRVLFREGQKNGNETFFKEDGTVVGEGKFVNGTPIGRHYLKNDEDVLVYEAVYDDQGTLTRPVRHWYDDGKQKEVFTRRGESLEGAHLSWYPNGNPKQDYNYVQNHFEGEQKEYYTNGQLKAHATYKAGIRQGNYEEWYENAVLAARVQFKDGKKHGVSEEWYPSGAMRAHEEYVADLLNGVRTTWYENGQIAATGAFADGKKIGEHRESAEDGKLLFVATYDQDRPQGEVKGWYKDGQQRFVSQYTDGVLNGTESWWHENGQPLSKTVYVNGVIDGVRETWFANGKIHVHQEYKLGKFQGEHFENILTDADETRVVRRQRYNDAGDLHGEQETFYPDGTRETLLVYENGKMHGRKAMWSAQGNLIEEANYVQGQLEGSYFQRLPDGRELVAQFSKNLKEGKQIVYYPTHQFFGRVKAQESDYSAGRLNGELSEYNQAGTKVASVFYKDGKREGLATMFSNDGKLFMTVRYKADLEDGPALRYYPKGEVEREVNFVLGVKQGQETSYHANGKVASTRTYKNGQLEGVCREYNDKGVLVFEADYVDGKRHGRFKKFYEDGKPRIEQTYIGDQPDGEKRIYNEKGEVTVSEFRKGRKV